MADSNPYRYAGYRFDDFTGLYYLSARYYDANLGRFISRDPLQLQVIDHQNANSFAYAANNPANKIDPSGLAPVEYGGGGGVVWAVVYILHITINKAIIRIGRSASRTITKVNPNLVVNALSNFTSKRMVYGNRSFALDKAGMKHILERHHPKYWNGTGADRRSVPVTCRINELGVKLEELIDQIGRLMF